METITVRELQLRAAQLSEAAERMRVRARGMNPARMETARALRSAGEYERRAADYRGIVEGILDDE